MRPIPLTPQSFEDITPSSLKGTADTAGGRAFLRAHCLTDGRFVLDQDHPLYTYLWFRAHYFFRDVPITVNGRLAVYADGKEGWSYYYADDAAREMRVHIKTGDRLVEVVGSTGLPAEVGKLSDSTKQRATSVTVSEVSKSVEVESQTAELETYRLALLKEVARRGPSHDYTTFVDLVQAAAHLHENPWGRFSLDAQRRADHSEARGTVSHRSRDEQNGYQKGAILFLSFLHALDSLKGGTLDLEEMRRRIAVLRVFLGEFDSMRRLPTLTPLLAANEWLSIPVPFPEKGTPKNRLEWMTEEETFVDGFFADLDTASPSMPERVKAKRMEAGLLYAKSHGWEAAHKAFGERFVGPFELGLLMKEGVDPVLPKTFPNPQEIERGVKLGANLIYLPANPSMGEESHWLMSMPGHLPSTREQNVVVQARELRDFLFKAGFLSPAESAQCSNAALQALGATMLRDPNAGMEQLRKLPVAKGFHTLQEIDVMHRDCLSHVRSFFERNGLLTTVKRERYNEDCEVTLTRPKETRGFTSQDTGTLASDRVQVITNYLPHDRSLGRFCLKSPMDSSAPGWRGEYPIGVRPVLGRWF